LKNVPPQSTADLYPRVERAYLVGLQHPAETVEEATILLDELQELADTLGVTVVGRTLAKATHPNPRLLIGSGRALEIVAAARSADAQVIVFDDPLGPSQQRNWEALADLTVVDREEIILDIFGRRAQTREASLQIALARAQYDLPRLARKWTHLSRQRGMRGGTGARGEGEQQIEVDARLVRTRIGRLHEQLEAVRRKRAVQRKQRTRKGVPTCAIVGYTNAGKSSLLNRLTGAGVATEDKLFATLDPTTRRLVLPDHRELLLSDTVGFIRKLPHTLIQAFKATLEEAAVADFLLEVIDVTSPQVEAHHETTRQVLAELGMAAKNRIIVFNKLDALSDPFAVQRLRRRFPDSVFVSARTGEGLANLHRRLSEEIERGLTTVNLLIPHDRYELVALLHRSCPVLSEKAGDAGVEIRAALPPDTLAAVRDFVQA